MRSGINIYCDESTHLPNDGMPFLVLGAVTSPRGHSRAVSQKLASLRKAHKLPRNFEIKWSKASPSKLSFYLNVVDLFFDDDHLAFRTVIAQKQGLNHERFNQSHDDWYYKMIYYLLRNILTHGRSAYVYLDKKDTLGGSKARRLHEILRNSSYDFDREFIKRIQIVESHHVSLMQIADFLIGAVNYANRGLSSSPAKCAIVEHIKARSGLSLTESTPTHDSKFNVFAWKPRVNDES